MPLSTHWVSGIISNRRSRTHILGSAKTYVPTFDHQRPGAAILANFEIRKRLKISDSGPKPEIAPAKDGMLHFCHTAFLIWRATHSFTCGR